MSAYRKCVVWDLDDTLWDGVCLEGNVVPRPGVRRVIEELDHRGILHSVASRGEQQVALDALRLHRLDRYFLAPQVNWLPKFSNVLTIARTLRLDTEAMVFIDDDQFEREQMAFMVPGVLVVPATMAESLPSWAEFCPTELSAEARSRRLLYRVELERHEAEQSCSDRATFLQSCRMQLQIRPMAEEDVPRVQELLTRTHQLNASGRQYSRAELEEILSHDSAPVAAEVGELTDRYGSYGLIAVAIIARGGSGCGWQLCQLAISCRVLGRGVERAFVTALINRAKSQGINKAEVILRETAKNRPLRSLLQMIGFRLIATEETNGARQLQVAAANVPPGPTWVEVR